MENGMNLGNILKYEMEKSMETLSEGFEMKIFGYEVGIKNSEGDVYYYAINSEGNISGCYLENNRHYVGDNGLWGHLNIFGELVQENLLDIMKGETVNLVFNNQKIEGTVVDAILKSYVQTPGGKLML